MAVDEKNGSSYVQDQQCLQMQLQVGICIGTRA